MKKVGKKKYKEDVETRDIRTAEAKQALYDSIGDRHIHLLVGGFPCQGFSLAGNRVVTDERNSLYREMLKIVEKIISDYRDIGYDINVTVLNSAFYGFGRR